MSAAEVENPFVQKEEEIITETINQNGAVESIEQKIITTTQDDQNNVVQEETTVTDVNGSVTVNNNKRKYEGDGIEQMDNKKPVLNGDILQNQGPTLTETVSCPSGLVGKLIGRQGETINIIQNASRCRVQVNHKEAGDPKVVSISGSREGIEKVKELIENVLYKDKNLNDEKREIECPPEYVGKIIGKSGDTIKALQQATGAKVHVNQDMPEGTNRKVNISGRMDGVEIAYRMVQELIQNENTSVRQVIQNQAKTVKYTERCPRSFVGKIIGKSGATIKELIKKTRAKIQINQDSDPCVITIEGVERSAQQAQKEVRELISGLSNQPSQTGGFGGAQGQMAQQYPAGGQFVPQHFNPGFATAAAQPFMGAQVMPQPQATAQPSYGAYSQYYGGYQQPQLGGYAQQYGVGQQYGSASASYGSVTPAAAQPASDWSEIKDPSSGRTYYFNRVTNQSQWEKPIEMP